MNRVEEKEYFGPLFDPDEAERRGDLGMKQAEEASRVVSWVLAAEDFLAVAGVGREFTADDLVKVIGVPDMGANRNNVIGAWFRAKANLGHIKFTGSMAKSERVDRHGGLQRVWKVL